MQLRIFIVIIYKYVALQLLRTKIDRIHCCQMAVERHLWLATQLSSRGWVDPVPYPILPEKFIGYSRGLNPGSALGW